LILDDAPLFSGAIGFTGNGNPSQSDQIDLKDINFASVSDSYSDGVLTVTDGTRTANLTLSGTYSLGNFMLSNDGQGGTLVIDPPVSQTLPSIQDLTRRLAGASGE
jgi:hypothetical protein